jgi:protein phosphatase 1 regulatory subunit 11
MSFATSSTAGTTTTTTTTTVTQPRNEYTVVLRRRPEVIRRNEHIRDGTLRVDWTNDTVDNEHLNKKKSKKCCIFKKKKPFDESSDESSWEDSDISDEEDIPRGDNE